MRHRCRVVAITLPALLLASMAFAATPVAAACASNTSLLNGGFEDAPITAGGQGELDAAEVPPWQTTDVIGQIEIWGDGFNGVPAGEGVLFAELNANSAGTLYQDVVTTPGATMTWSLLHRGRGGDDVMHVLIGDAATADVNSDTGWDVVSGDLLDGIAAWGAHTDDYVVPAGQTCTRFAFRAVSAGSGDDSVGNFLDDIAFSVSVPSGPVVTPPPTDGVAATTGTAADPTTIIGLFIALFVALAFAIHRFAPRPGRQR